MSKSATSFSRDNLYISLYRSCGHRTTALTDASALTDTVIAKLLINPKEPGLFTTVQIKAICKEILKAFDTTAATYYEAYYR